MLGGSGVMNIEGSETQRLIRRPVPSGFGYGDPSLQAEQEVAFGSRKVWLAGYVLQIAAAVTRAPTMAVFVDGKIAKSIVGAKPKSALLRDLESYL